MMWARAEKVKMLFNLKEGGDREDLNTHSEGLKSFSKLSLGGDRTSRKEGGGNKKKELMRGRKGEKKGARRPGFPQKDHIT